MESIGNNMQPNRKRSMLLNCQKPNVNI